MRNLFKCEVGLSDHTMGIGVSVSSVSLGATVIEKHFTLDRSEGGVDSTFSMEPKEMSDLVIETERAWQALGDVHYGVTEAEKITCFSKNTIYCERLKKGEIFNKENVRAIRPGLGLPTKYLDVVWEKGFQKMYQRVLHLHGI